VNLDKVTIEIRPRTPWEAVDLGLLMARRWWWPLTRVWLLLTLPPYLLLSLLFQNYLWVPILLIWWLKPLFERPLLYLLSHAVFGHLPDTRSALRAFPPLAARQWFASLTWRRLSPNRSMDLPVLQLEGLSGYRRSDRLSLLHREGSAPALWLLAIGIYLEMFITLGLLVLLYALLPSEIYINFPGLDLTFDSLWFEYLMLMCAYLAMSAVAPFYVACGFSLYLNRRITLEAWDLDIAFKRIVNKRSSAGQSLALMALVICLGFFSSLPLDAKANQSPSSEQAFTSEALPYNRDSARQAIDTIVRGEDFMKEETRRRLAFQEKKKPQSVDWTWLEKLFDYLSGLRNLAKLMEFLLWLSVIALLIFLVLKYRYWLASYLPISLEEKPRPVTLFGMDVTRESLPQDVGASALALWQAGNARAALALLYRASLSRLLEAGLDIEDGNTEEECLELAKAFTLRQPRARGAIGYFSRLTRAWQQLAYGHQLPDTSLAENLCHTWGQAWTLDQEPTHE
jgi:hypothetical protein